MKNKRVNRRLIAALSLCALFLCVFLVSCQRKATPEESEIDGVWDSGSYRIMLIADQDCEISIGEKYGFNYHYDNIGIYRYRETKVTNEDTVYVYEYTISKQWDSEKSKYTQSKDTKTYTFEYHLTTKKLTLDSKKYART